MTAVTNSSSAPPQVPSLTVSTRQVGLLGRSDLQNMGLLLLGFACVLLMVHPARIFPVSDDWIYSHSVGDLLRWDYKLPIEAQANLFSHVAWGALFAVVFGNSFTTLTVSTLVMSVASLIMFYLLLRHLDVTPGYALLGTAILGFNPLYLFLSYSFMTEVTFIGYSLAACLCLVCGMRGYGEVWLWLGGGATALAYLDRQPGLLLMVAALVYLFWSRAWSWRRAIAISALPITAAIVYALWERTQPPLLTDALLSGNLHSFMQDPLGFMGVRGIRLAWMVLPLGLYLAPLVRLPRRPILAALIFAPLAIAMFWSLRNKGSVFPMNGNVLDNTGLVMWYYQAAPIWSEWVWTMVGIVSAVLLSFYLVTLLENAHDWWRTRRQRIANPALILYLFGLLMVALIVFVMPSSNDRYMLPVLPLMMLPALRRMSAAVQSSQESQASRSIHWRWALLAPLAIFSVIGQRDYMEHTLARWNMAENLAAQGVPRYQINAGHEWLGLYVYEDGVRRLRETGDFPPRFFPAFAILDPVYVASDMPMEGYSAIGSQPYASWLNGGQMRSVLLLKRTDASK